MNVFQWLFIIGLLGLLIWAPITILCILIAIFLAAGRL